jgi:hypothetical protein
MTTRYVIVKVLPDRERDISIEMRCMMRLSKTNFWRMFHDFIDNKKGGRRLIKKMMTSNDNQTDNIRK